MAKKITRMYFLRPKRRHPVDVSAPPPCAASGAQESATPLAAASAVGAGKLSYTDKDRAFPSLEAVLPHVLPGPPPAIVSHAPPASSVIEASTCVAYGGSACPAAHEDQAQSIRHPFDKQAEVAENCSVAHHGELLQITLNEGWRKHVKESEHGPCSLSPMVVLTRPFFLVLQESVSAESHEWYKRSRDQARFAHDTLDHQLEKLNLWTGCDTNTMSVLREAANTILSEFGTGTPRSFGLDARSQRS